MAAAEEEDVASYVLAYLVSNKYSQTASTFLQECKYFGTPPNNVMILPQIPLKQIINEHKIRQNTAIMVKSLGAQQAWKGLWTKLQRNLEQINSLANGITTLNEKPTTRTKRNLLQFSHNSKPHQLIEVNTTLLAPTTPPSVTPVARNVLVQPPSTPPSVTPVARNVLVQPPLTPPSVTPVARNVLVQPPSTPPSVTPVACNVLVQPPSTPPSVTPVSCDIMVLPSSTKNVISTMPINTKSPRKKKFQSPKRKEFPTVPPPPPPPPPPLPPPPQSSNTDQLSSQNDDLQQMFDALLSNEELPEKLAGIINQYVGSSETSSTLDTTPITTSSSFLSQTALDNILDLTCTDNWLDDLLASSSENSVTLLSTQDSSDVKESMGVGTHVGTAVSEMKELDNKSIAPVEQEFKTGFHTTITSETSSLVNTEGSLKRSLCKNDSHSVEMSKKPKLEDMKEPETPSLTFPAGVDLEKFLDKLHNQD